MKSVKPLDLLFVRRCVLCRRDTGGDGDLCPECAAFMESERERRLQRAFLSADVVCAAEYQGALRSAILRMKESGKNAGIGALTEQVWLAYEYQRPDFHPDIVTYVPSSILRERARGFLIPEKLARYFAARLDVPCEELLVHTAFSIRQAGLSAVRRKAHAKDTISIRDSVNLTGKRILLADDIVTSGSTMERAASLLRDAGAAEVLGVTLAAGGHFRKGTE